MPTISNTDYTSHYRYRITRFEIIIPNEDIISVVSGHINAFNIIKNYDEDIFPIFHVNYKLDTPTYYKIVTNKTTVKFRIRLEKFKYNNSENVILNTELAFDAVFAIYIGENSEFMDKSLNEMKLNTLKTNSDPMDLQNYDFYFFKEKDLNSSKVVFNTILTGASLETAVSYMFSVSGSTNILMSQIENKTIIDEILLLPVSVNKNISYLENQYGFYSYGLTLFYDIDRIYFIDKRPECTAYEPGEYQKVLIHVSGGLTSRSMTPGSYKDATTRSYMVYVTRNNASLQTTSIVQDQLLGNEINVVSTQSDSVTTINPELQQRGTASKTVSVNNYNNPYAEKMLEYRTTENNNIIIISITDIEMECFTPNKKFLFTFDDSSTQELHGGAYRLTEISFGFNKNGENFTPVAIGTFKKPV